MRNCHKSWKQRRRLEKEHDKISFENFRDNLVAWQKEVLDFAQNDPEGFRRALQGVFK